MGSASDSRPSSDQDSLFSNPSTPLMKLMTASGECRSMAPGWADLTGQTIADAVGMGWLNCAHQDDRSKIGEVIASAVAQGEPFHVGYRLRHRDGTYRSVWETGVARDDARSEFVCLICVVPEVGSVAVAGDRDDRDAMARIAQLERELAAAKAETEACMQAKERLLSMLSHELRTPLTPALITVTTLEQDPQLPEQLRDDVDLIRRNIELESKLIDDLLDLSRLTSGKARPQLQTVDLHEAIRHVLRLCRSQLAVKRIEVVGEPGDDPMWVTADRARLQQVVWNLMKNAVQFTPDGKIIYLATARLAGARADFTVRDTGVGIESDSLATLFDPFSGSSSAHRNRGLGLGLAISKAIVDMHDWTLRAESEGLGQGATFRLELPLADQMTLGQSREGLSSTTADAGARLRLLLVEDHGDTAKVLGRCLEALGHGVHTANSAAEAIRLFEQHEFDLILSDIGLPDATGYELMSALRRRAAVPGISISGYGMEEDIVRSREAGFGAHVIKPIQMAELEEIISRLTAPAEVPTS